MLINICSTIYLLVFLLILVRISLPGLMIVICKILQLGLANRLDFLIQLAKYTENIVYSMNKKMILKNAKRALSVQRSICLYLHFILENPQAIKHIDVNRN